MGRLIDADKLSADMYHEAFEKDSDMQKWDSGCWIRYKMFENVLKAQPTVEPEAISKWKKEFREYVDSLDIARDDWKGIIGYIDELPSAQPETNCSEFPNNSDTISRQAAIDFVGSMNMCDEISNEAYKKLTSYLDELPSAQPERTCLNCGRTANNGGWYADGRTRCPIEEHYALPKDGYCHLWEKRNVTDDDYPERREE